MKLRFYFLFIFFSILFLFYPGNSYYYRIFAFNRDLFNKVQKQEKIDNIFPIPYLKANYYPEVSAEGVYIVDKNSFTPVYEKNIKEKLLPASTTKIITALVAADLYRPDKIITIKKVRYEGQTMGLVEGEKITVENLLNGLLIYSGNDAAYALADSYGFDRFVDLMNEKAQSLNMKDSYFKNPAGLDNYEQVTTPFDLALASRELLKNELLSRIVSIKEITISDVDFKIFHQLSNVNKLLGEIQGIGGLKTGYTENAGENLVSLYRHDGHDFIIVILKSDDRFEDTKKIVNWIEENVDYKTIEN